MRTILHISFCLWCLFASVPSVASDPPQCSHITASGHPDYPPFSWRQGDEIVGTSVDLLKEASAALGVTLTVRYSGHWKRVVSRMTTGHLDMIVALYKNQEREKHMVFSPPVLDDPIALFSPAQRAFPFTSLKDLQGKRGAIVHGDIFGPALDPQMQALRPLVRAQNLTSLLQLLALNRVDYAIYGEFPLRAALIKSGSSDTVQKIATIGAGISYFAMSRGSPCHHLIQPLSDKIREVKAARPVAHRIKADFMRWTDTPATSQASP